MNIFRGGRRQQPDPADERAYIRPLVYITARDGGLLWGSRAEYRTDETNLDTSTTRNRVIGADAELEADYGPSRAALLRRRWRRGRD